MHNANFAERILELFIDRERAATIVGDLAETAQTRGAVWFWRSVASAAIGLGWRTAAMFVGCMAMLMAVAAAMAKIMNAISVMRHGRALAPIGPILGFSAMLLSGVALYAAFRYGMRDWLTRLAAAIALVTFVGGALQQTPFVPQAAIVGVIGLMILAVFSRDGRRALWATVAAFLASAAVFVAVVMVNNRHRAVAFFPVNYAVIIGAQWWVCSRVRRRSAPA